MAAWSKVSWGDLFTLANGLMGFVAITFILDDRFLIATSLLFLSMMMDGLDGYVARRFGSKHSMGQVLDSSRIPYHSLSPRASRLCRVQKQGHKSARERHSPPLRDCNRRIWSVQAGEIQRGRVQMPHFQGMPAPAGALASCSFASCSARRQGLRHQLTTSQ